MKKLDQIKQENINKSVETLIVTNAEKLKGGNALTYGCVIKKPGKW
jgi:hypothetical protein